MLVVDDEEPILYALREYFVAQGYRVDCARELREALSMLGGECYDVVIVDLALSASHEPEGLEVLAHVHERCPSSRVVVLTAYGSPEVEAEAYRRGVDAFLHKPKPLSEVAHLLGSLLGRQA
jgi:CheY-like chemotaxis protein